MLKINLAYSSSTIHYKPMQWHCILLFPGPGMFAIRAPEEESSEMVEEMDTSEAVWCWYYLAECGVWHMFEVQDISLHLCIPHPSILSLDLSIHSFIIPSIHPPIYCIHPSTHPLTHSTHPSLICNLFWLWQIDPSAACSVTSEQIEQNYSRNQHGVMEFYTAKYTYRLDFSGTKNTKVLAHIYTVSLTIIGYVGVRL